MAKMDDVKVTVDADFMRELKRIRAALEALAPEKRSKVDAALDQAAEEFHTKPVRIVEPAADCHPDHPAGRGPVPGGGWHL